MITLFGIRIHIFSNITVFLKYKHFFHLTFSKNCQDIFCDDSSFNVIDDATSF